MTTKLFRVMKLLPSRVFRSGYSLALVLYTLQYIHVVWNFYEENDARGFPFSWGAQNFMTPVHGDGARWLSIFMTAGQIAMLEAQLRSGRS